MKLIDRVRIALIGAGFVRVNVQEASDTRSRESSCIERWIHVRTKEGEEYRAPMMVWHANSGGHEEIDVFGSLTTSTNIDDLVAAIQGEHACGT